MNTVYCFSTLYPLDVFGGTPLIIIVHNTPITTTVAATLKKMNNNKSHRTPGKLFSTYLRFKFTQLSNVPNQRSRHNHNTFHTYSLCVRFNILQFYICMLSIQSFVHWVLINEHEMDEHRMRWTNDEHMYSPKIIGCFL